MYCDIYSSMIVEKIFSDTIYIYKILIYVPTSFIYEKITNNNFHFNVLLLELQEIIKSPIENS